MTQKQQTARKGLNNELMPFALQRLDRHDRTRPDRLKIELYQRINSPYAQGNDVAMGSYYRGQCAVKVFPTRAHIDGRSQSSWSLAMEAQTNPDRAWEDWILAITSVGTLQEAANRGHS